MNLTDTPLRYLLVRLNARRKLQEPIRPATARSNEIPLSSIMVFADGQRLEKAGPSLSNPSHASESICDEDSFSHSRSHAKKDSDVTQ